VKALENLFRKRFGYYTKTVDLSDECTCALKCLCSPQHRFNRAVSRFMEKNDAEHNLTIIYYTGHGSYVNKTETSPGFLRLHAYELSAVFMMLLY
jgi:Caspase domain